MRRYEDVVENGAGVPIASASVDVYLKGTSTPATIYSDDGVTTKTNPVTTDSLGVFSFYVADGRYDLRVTGTGLTTTTQSDVEVADLHGGAALVVGNFALSAGWGNTASVGTLTGTGQRFRVTVTSAGTGQAANPTVTLTFPAGTWLNVPFFVCSRGGGSLPTVQFAITTVTTAALTLTFQDTPIAGQTYTLSCLGVG